MPSLYSCPFNLVPFLHKGHGFVCFIRAAMKEASHAGHRSPTISPDIRLSLLRQKKAPSCPSVKRLIVLASYCGARIHHEQICLA